MSFFKGFGYAFLGILHCIKNERNMRFHTVAALYVLVFARFFDFSCSEWLVLFLTIGAVIAAEMINTAIEELCDKVTQETDPHIKHSKDAAAGAVLVLAIFAAVIGVFLFWNAEGWIRLYTFYMTHPWNLTAVVLLAVCSVFYIVWGPVGLKERCRGKKNSSMERKKKHDKD